MDKKSSSTTSTYSSFTGPAADQSSSQDTGGSGSRGNAKKNSRGFQTERIFSESILMSVRASVLRPSFCPCDSSLIDVVSVTAARLHDKKKTKQNRNRSTQVNRTATRRISNGAANGTGRAGIRAGTTRTGTSRPGTNTNPGRSSSKAKAIKLGREAKRKRVTK